MKRRENYRNNRANLIKGIGNRRVKHVIPMKSNENTNNQCELYKKYMQKVYPELCPDVYPNGKITL